MKKFLVALIIVAVSIASYAFGSVNGTYEGHPVVQLYVDGHEIVVEDVPAFIYNDRTMIPVYMLNQLGFTVDWNEGDYSVNVQQPEPITVTQVVYEYVYVNDEGETVPTPTPSPTPEPNGEQSEGESEEGVEPTPSPTPTPDPQHAIKCQQIRDSYILQIGHIDATKPNGWAYKMRLLEYQMEQELAALGCD